MSTKRGVVHFPNGDKYKGQIESNKRSGPGEYKFSDSSFYEGTFMNDNRHGKGVFMTYEAPPVKY